jgi:hypothetical protein
MTTEKTDRSREYEEKCAAMGCCSPLKMAEMMARCGEDMKCECGPMMQEMMKGGYWKQKEK